MLQTPTVNITHKEYNDALKKVRAQGRKELAMELGMIINLFPYPLNSQKIDELLGILCDKIKENL